MTKPSRIKTRDRETIIQALRAGLVPKVGLQHLQVGRAAETKEMIRDIERISDGGATIRCIIGSYGAGKTFFLSLTRQVALHKGLVVMSADLAPDRRLHATGGQARSLYMELTRNAGTRTQPLGGAMPAVVERFIQQSRQQADEQGIPVRDVIRTKLSHLEELTRGYDFAFVLGRYWEGYKSNNDDLKNAALRWLRGEYRLKTEANKALGARSIIDDQNIYDHLKLMALFVRSAGYKGLLVSLDEMVNIYKLVHSRARAANYEQLLRITNDVLQGTASYLGFCLGGTPEFLLDTRRGVYSYEALQSRLAANTFATDKLVDLSGPVITLQNLTPEDLYVLLSNIRRVMDHQVPDLPNEALQAFMQHCSNRIGDAYWRTPRNTIKAFVGFLSILAQYPETRWQELLSGVSVDRDPEGADPSVGVSSDDDELATFRL